MRQLCYEIDEIMQESGIIDCLDYIGNESNGWLDVSNADGWDNSPLDSRVTFNEVCNFIDEKYYGDIE